MGLGDQVESFLEGVGRLALGFTVALMATIYIVFVYGLAMFLFRKFFGIELPDPSEGVQTIRGLLQGGER